MGFAGGAGYAIAWTEGIPTNTNLTSVTLQHVEIWREQIWTGKKGIPDIRGLPGGAVHPVAWKKAFRHTGNKNITFRQTGLTFRQTGLHSDKRDYTPTNGNCIPTYRNYIPTYRNWMTMMTQRTKQTEIWDKVRHGASRKMIHESGCLLVWKIQRQPRKNEHGGTQSDQFIAMAHSVRSAVTRRSKEKWGGLGPWSLWFTCNLVLLETAGCAWLEWKNWGWRGRKVQTKRQLTTAATTTTWRTAMSFCVLECFWSCRVSKESMFFLMDFGCLLFLVCDWPENVFFP